MAAIGKPANTCVSRAPRRKVVHTGPSTGKQCPVPRGVAAACLANQNCGARPHRGRAALSKWFARQTAATECPTTASGPPPHCGGEAFGTASNRVLIRLRTPYMASLRQVRRCTSRRRDSIYAVRSWRAPHRRPYGGIRMYVVETEFAFPFGGPNARENVQWTFSSEDGPVRPMGGAPAGGGRGPRSFPLLPHRSGEVPAKRGIGHPSHTAACRQEPLNEPG